MKRVILFLLFIVLLLPSCSKNTGTNIKVVKPSYHHRWYDRKKDKRVKRTRVVRVKN